MAIRPSITGALGNRPELVNVKIRWPLLENHRLEFLLSSYKTFRKHLSLIRKNLHQVAKRASGDQEGAAWRVPGG